MKKVAVICRGKSLDYIDKLPEMDLYVIVNRFGHELEIDKIKDTLMGKNIHHVMSRVPEEPIVMIQREHYEKFNILKLINMLKCNMHDKQRLTMHSYKRSGKPIYN